MRHPTLLVLTFLGLGIGTVPDAQAADQARTPLRDTSMAAMTVLAWQPRAPGVWSATVGTAELGPMTFAGSPRIPELRELGEPALPEALREARGDLSGVTASVRLPIGPDERLYGLGMRAEGGVDLRQRSFRLRVTPSSHAPTPFYISSAGYGVVINAARVVNIYMGTGNRRDAPYQPEEIDRTTDKRWTAQPRSDAVEANLAGSGMEVLVFAGRNPLEVVRRYNLYCGGGCLPPRWALGFWHRTGTRASADQVAAEAAEFAQRDMPLDVLGLEPGWQSQAYPCSYEWDPKRFPDPKGFIARMAAQGIAVNLWENLFVSTKAPIFPALQPYLGSHTYWSGQVPDYTLPEARAALMEQHRRSQISIGVAGYKIDEVDELAMEHMRFPSGLCGEQMRQIQGLAMQKEYLETFRRLNRRTCGLVRGSNAGGSPYPFALYSDTYAHRGYLQAMANSSLAGVLWCSEVRDAASDEDWVRRFQTAMVSPIMQLNGWSSGAKPWSRPAVTDLVRAQLKLRSRLTPYLYTAMADYQRRGIPPIRHMILEDGYRADAVVVPGTLDAEKNPYAESQKREVADQFMVGPSLLVAPLIAGETARKVVLPQGRWYDFTTGALVGDGGTITVSATLEQVPMFVKDGGIIPLMPPVNTLRQAGTDIRLEVRHYGIREGSYRLYDDDGETFDYERGISCEQELRAIRQGTGLKGETGPVTGPWRSRYTGFTWTFMTPAGK